MEPVLLVAALFAAVVGGPWLAQVAARSAARDDTVRADWLQAVAMTVVFAVLLVGAVELTGARPATAPWRGPPAPPSSSGRWTWRATGCRTA